MAINKRCLGNVLNPIHFRDNQILRNIIVWLVLTLTKVSGPVVVTAVLTSSIPLITSSSYPTMGWTLHTLPTVNVCSIGTH